MTTDAEIRRLALACLVPGFVGPTPPSWLLDGLVGGLGGVILFGSNLGDGSNVEALTGQLRAAAGGPIVLGLDEEGGDVTRLDTVRGSAAPGAAALGWLDDPAATEAVYAAIGARLAAAGVTLNLAPVADVNVDPDNPVIGVRSFSADPAMAARQVAAAVHGIQRSGVAACAKHFPGHGATSADSHHEVATVERDRDQLAAVEFRPFRAAIGAGSRAVMTGHLLVPSLDAELATVSRAITTGVLREQLGFTGTIVTDALEMAAVSSTVGMVEGFVAALAAGADTIETGARDYPELLTAIPDAVLAAVRAGRLSFDRLADAARRTALLAEPAVAEPPPATDGIAARCLEAIGTLPRLVDPVVVECRPASGMASGPLPWTLAGPLHERIPGAEVVTVDGPESLAGLAGWAGRSLVAVVRDPSRHRWQCRLLELAVGQHRAGMPTVVVDVGWPVELPELAGLPLVRTRGVAPGLLAAAADLLVNA
ncbi:MAG TPA: glycoside hydrolase family 3 N-terminal domain-containing protein [Jatrophihabitans sp.]|nr:glycoside hydrolase family 3 N-terminal domain-containing protein [Jatrophihabitans sp.]